MKSFSNVAIIVCEASVFYFGILMVVFFHEHLYCSSHHFFLFFLPEKLVWSEYFLESLQIKLTLTSSSFAFESQTIQNTECSMAFWVLLLLPCVLPLLLFSSELKNKRNWLNKMLIIYRIESHVDDQVSHVLLLDKLRVAE